MKRLPATLTTTLLLAALSACSSVPKQIQTAPLNDIQLSQVRSQVESFAEQEVRWGGEVVAVENNNDASIIQIVQYPLNHYGKPIPNNSSDGRFLARTTEFIDPVVYKQGTLVTFTGSINEEATRQVDKKELLMPVIDVNSLYKWPRYRTIQRDPFYDPFYYNGFYPYHGFYSRYWYHPRFGYHYYY